MLLTKERRSEQRMPCKRAIRYSFPSLNSYCHDLFYRFAKRICKSSRILDTLMNRFVASSLAEPLVWPKKTWGTTGDISFSGLSIVAPHRFRPGQDLLIFYEGLSNRPVPVSVKWCARHSDEMFKAGLKYNNLSLVSEDGLIDELAGVPQHQS